MNQTIAQSEADYLRQLQTAKTYGEFADIVSCVHTVPITKLGTEIRQAFENGRKRFKRQLSKELVRKFNDHLAAK